MVLGCFRLCALGSSRISWEFVISVLNKTIETKKHYIRGGGISEAQHGSKVLDQEVQPLTRSLAGGATED